MLKLMNHSRYGTNQKMVKSKEPSLTYPIGLTQGTMNQTAVKVEARADLLTATCCHYAYAFSFIKPPTAWTSKDINDILVASKANLDCAKTCCDQLEIPLAEENLINRFQISNYTVDLKLPYASDVIGKIQNTNQPGISNTLQGLKKFFRRAHRACIFKSGAVQLMIWKTSGILYVFDPMGRKENCSPDHEKGNASLICLETMTNLNTLIVKLSGLKPDEFYVLKELRVNTLTKSNANNKFKCKSKNLPPDPTFVTISEQMAILYGSINVSNACFKETRNCQTLTSCCIAYIYSLINPPNTWTQSSVDKVLLFGNQLYEECVNGRIPEQFTVSHVPTIISLGPYRAGISIRPYHSGGRLHHTVDQKASELIKSLTLYFLERTCTLLQVDQLHFAIWKRGSVFYLFDPYGRNASDTDSTLKSGVASLQIHSTLESMCSTMYSNLIRIAEKERFYLHDLNSSILSEKCGDSSIVEINDDQQWLNESIDSLYTPKINCQQQEPNVKSLCNLDSPTVSATQFIRPWQVMKGDTFKKAESALSSSDSGSGLSDDDDDEADEDEGHRNNDLGLEDDEYTDLLDFGLSPEDIAAYHALGLSIHDMKKWFSNGIQPEDVARLLKAGVTLDDYKTMKKLNLSIDEILKLKELDIPPKLFAKLKKQGVAPDKMTSAIAANKDLQKFKEMELNKCEIEKLTAAGVSAETYEQATKEMGLSFEEVRNSVLNNIPLEEFSRQKELGMNSLDVIRANELNITPEAYLELKDKGLTPDDMEKMKEQGLTAEEYIAKQEEEEGKSVGEDMEEGEEGEKMEELKKAEEEKKADEQKTDEEKAEEKKKDEDKTDDAKAEEKKNEDKTDEKKKEEETTEKKKGDDEKNEGDKTELKKGEDKKKEGDKTEEQTQEDEKAKKKKKRDKKEGDKKDEEGEATEKEGDEKVGEKKTKEKKSKSDKKKDDRKSDDRKSDDRKSDDRKSDRKSDKKKSKKKKSKSDAGDSESDDDGSDEEPISRTEQRSSLSIVPASSVESIDRRRRRKQTNLSGSRDSKLREIPLDRSKRSTEPKFNMTVIKSAKVSPISFQKLLQESFKVVDRVLILNSNNEPNCVAFEDPNAPSNRQYYLYEGCDCNVHHIRRLVLSKAKSCLSSFPSLDKMIVHIIRRLKSVKPNPQQRRRDSTSESRSIFSQDWPSDSVTREVTNNPPRRERGSNASRYGQNYARDMLDEQLESLDQRFDDLLNKFQTLANQS